MIKFKHTSKQNKQHCESPCTTRKRLISPIRALGDSITPLSLAYTLAISTAHAHLPTGTYNTSKM